jgi:hypothetical protein
MTGACNMWSLDIPADVYGWMGQHSDTLQTGGPMRVQMHGHMGQDLWTVRPSGDCSHMSVDRWADTQMQFRQVGPIMIRCGLRRHGQLNPAAIDCTDWPTT